MDRHGRVGALPVHVDNVRDAGDEDQLQAQADKITCDHLRDPVHVSGPAEPQQRRRQDHGAQSHGRESPLGLRGRLVLGNPGFIPGQGEERANAARRHDAQHDGDERQLARRGGPAALPVRQRERLEREVERAVDEGQVRREDNEDRLRGKHPHGLREVLVHDVLELDGRLFGLGVQRPVARREAQPPRLALQDPPRRRLPDAEAGRDAEARRDDERRPGRPGPPRRIAVGQAGAGDGRDRRAEVDARRGYGHGDAAQRQIVQLVVLPRYDRVGAGAEGTGEEAADEDGGDVFGERDGQLEGGESQHGHGEGN